MKYRILLCLLLLGMAHQNQFDMELLAQLNAPAPQGNAQPNLSPQQQSQLLQLANRLMHQNNQQAPISDPSAPPPPQSPYRFTQKKHRNNQINIRNDLVPPTFATLGTGHDLYHYPSPHSYPLATSMSPISPMVPNSMLNGNLNYDHGMSPVNFPNTHPSQSAEPYMQVPKPGVLSSYPVTASSTHVGVNNHGNGLQSTEHVLPLKGNLQAQNANSNSDFPLRVPSIGQCPCAGGQECKCGENGPQNEACGCAPKPACPPCIVAKTIRQMHQMASDYAAQDIETQSNLNKESLLEKKLFEQAQKYAQDAEHEEEEARKSALDLQAHSSKAQTDRNKMLRAEQQAKQIALDSIRTMTVHPPHEIAGLPGMKVEKTGTKVNTITEKTPYYNLNIGRTDGSGFNDLTAQAIHQDIAESYMNAPDLDPLSKSFQTSIPNINQQPDGLVSGGEFSNYETE